MDPIFVKLEILGQGDFEKNPHTFIIAVSFTSGLSIEQVKQLLLAAAQQLS